MGTELRVFEQFDEGDTAVLARNAILATFTTKRIISTDGVKGEMQQDETDYQFTGIVRKQLGLVLGRD